MKIGFIGLGIMGKPMAKNLLKAGYTDLLVNNRSHAAVEELEAAGAKGATQAEIGEACDVVITMLPNSPQVKQVMLGDAGDGVASHMKPGSIFVDCSSINPVASKEIAAVLAERGVEMLDAPVSGGEPKAIDGTLSFMVGGKQEVFDKCKDILAAMGASVVRCGEVGAGNYEKQDQQKRRRPGSGSRINFKLTDSQSPGSRFFRRKRPGRTDRTRKYSSRYRCPGTRNAGKL